jgi:hypothetical protein
MGKHTPHPMLAALQQQYDQHPDRELWEANNAYSSQDDRIKLRAGTLMLLVNASPRGLSRVLKLAKKDINGYTGKAYKSRDLRAGSARGNFPIFSEGMSTRDYVALYCGLSLQEPYPREACVDSQGNVVKYAVSQNAIYASEFNATLSYWQQFNSRPCTIYDPNFPEVLEEVLEKEALHEKRLLSIS